MPPQRLPRVRTLLEACAEAQRATAREAGEAIAAAAGLLVEAFGRGARVFAFGNGGSMAQAEHLAAELSGRFGRERAPLPALALGASAAEASALANDYGFEQLFERALRAQARPGDVAIALSTSGRSPNVLGGAREARRLGLRSVALTGAGGGPLAGLVDLAIVVPSDSTPRIQEAHLAVIHALCAIVEDELFPAPGAEAR